MKLRVKKPIESCLADTQVDSYLEISKFILLANSILSFVWSMHNGIYRAIIAYLKVYETMLGRKYINVLKNYWNTPP